MPDIKVKLSQHKLRRWLELKELADEFNALTKEFKEAAQAGFDLQKGPLMLAVSRKPGQRRPPWKDHASKLAHKFREELGVVDGEAWAQAIIDSTKPGNPSLSVDVIDTRNSIQEG